MGRILGLDVGDKTIGVAVSDELGLLAHGVTTLKRQGKKTDLPALANFVTQYEIAEIVVGLPLNMDESLGEQAQKTVNFAKRLEAHFPRVKITFWDERLTTVVAHELMLEANLRRKKRKNIIDTAAAIVILQSYLDRVASPLI